MDEIDLSSFFHTKPQSNDFLVRLSVISEGIYETGFNLETSLTNNFGLEKKDKFIVFLRDSGVNTGSPAELKDFLDKLQEKITKLPTLSLTLSFEPKETTLNLLNEWFMLNIKKQFVFDITVDTSLIAGVAINFNGKYQDYSVKTKFNKILKDILGDQTQNTPFVKHLVLGQTT